MKAEIQKEIKRKKMNIRKMWERISIDEWIDE